MRRWYLGTLLLTLCDALTRVAASKVLGWSDPSSGAARTNRGIARTSRAFRVRIGEFEAAPLGRRRRQRTPRCRRRQAEGQSSRDMAREERRQGPARCAARTLPRCRPTTSQTCTPTTTSIGDRSGPCTRGRISARLPVCPTSRLGPTSFRSRRICSLPDDQPQTHDRSARWPLRIEAVGRRHYRASHGPARRPVATMEQR